MEKLSVQQAHLSWFATITLCIAPRKFQHLGVKLFQSFPKQIDDLED
jgi:hypothetical protein